MISCELFFNNRSLDNARDNNREERQDRTANNWRSAPREDAFSRDTNRENYGVRNGSNDFHDRSMQRSRNDDFSRRPFDNDRGFRSNDRGFDSRPNNYSNDRNYDRPMDRGFDRQSNRYGSRFNDGPEDSSRDYGFDSERSFGRRYEDPRQGNRSYGDRRSERSDNRRDYGFERRGRDEYDTRNTSPPPLRDSEENRPKERQRLQLQPRSKPISNEESTTASSAIFGGAKPVNTAARELEIEEKLLKEREETDRRREPIEERVRRISSGSNHSGNSRSRKGSESGRDLDDDRRNGSQRGLRSRKTSERSDKSGSDAPKYLMTRNKESNSSSKYVSVRNEDDGRDPRSRNRGNASNRLSSNDSNSSNRRRDRDRDGREGKSEVYRPPRMANRSEDDDERKGLIGESVGGADFAAKAYTTSNKFAHLPTEDYEEDGTHNTSD